MENEIWKPILGYEHYQVSNMGRVMGKVILKAATGVGKYLYVSLSKNNKTKSCKVHRLVAIAFIENPENKPQVNHKKGVKSDNRASELEWMTRDENLQHARDNKLFYGNRNQKGELNNGAKLDNAKVVEILELYKSGGYTQAALAKQFKVSVANINKIVVGEYWGHLSNKEKIFISRKNTKILVLDTSNGIFYESISGAAKSKNMNPRSLSDTLKSKNNRTSFIKV